MRVDVPTRVNGDNGLSVGDRVPRNRGREVGNPTERTYTTLQSTRSLERLGATATKWLLLENCIAFSDNYSQVSLLDIKCDVLTEIATHDSCESSYALAVHPETPHVILSAGTDSKVLSIDIRESKSKELLVVKQGALKLKVALFSINSNPSNSNEFCISGRSYCVMIYDRRKVSKPLCKLWPKCVKNDEHVSIMSAVYNYNGTEILATYSNKKLYLFNKLITSYGDYGHMYQNHVYESSMIGGNFFGPKSEYVISGSGNNIFIWDKNSESVIQYMTGDSEIVICLDSHPHIPILATSGHDKNIKLWVPSKGELSVMQTSGNVKVTFLYNLFYFSCYLKRVI
ncbi:DDB1- and CUL4-associated factor 8 [Trachymyrmex cornetzi]|uniref:DDB1-and CUL4-associated factor 8 n=1 Tax=Trachymyrmex cornetzi TaxID=471704 RepID=A0A195DTP6_9HYME|nr:DDB1- and CUL4-associated factor 8 [Trachymyrmex cornetzi]